MNMRKVIAAFLAGICILGLLPLGAFAQGGRTVYAQTDATVQQGNYGYCYIYLDDLTDLASLNVAVHYDPEIITVIEHYNQVSAPLYDSSNQNGCLQYSYIFSGEDLSGQKSLFYFCYKVSENAPVGESYLDIVITDALNASLETVDISGSRCKFTITESQISRKCYVYGSGDISTSVQQQIQLDYYLSTWDIASGAFVIEYDPELFAFEELTCGGFLENKVMDVNSDLPGAIYVSFLGTEYNWDTHLISVKFRTIKNETTTTQINLRVTELYDLELNSIFCNGYTSTVTLQHDPSYIADAPAMVLGASFNEETKQVTLVIHLEADSHLGAGDFVLEFDENYLTFVSVQKGFNPSFFNINSKEVTDGLLKFSIISLRDIVEAETVMTVTFDAKASCSGYAVDFMLSGTGVSDAMTNPITLNFVSTSLENVSVGHHWSTVPTSYTIHEDGTHTAHYACTNDPSHTRSDDPVAHDFSAGDCVCGAKKAGIKGDFNLDGKVDSDDLTMLARHVGRIEELNGQALLNADVNDDGSVNSDDLTKHARYVGRIITSWDQE